MTTLDALQATLASEHACIYGYGVLGPHASEQDRDGITSAYQAHVVRRDEFAAQIRARSAEPVAALPAYALPFPVHDAGTALRLAGLLENRVAVLYADLVAAATNLELREIAARALVTAAVRAAGWTGRTTPLPGIDAG